MYPFKFKIYVPSIHGQWMRILYPTFMLRCQDSSKRIYPRENRFQRLFGQFSTVQNTRNRLFSDKIQFRCTYDTDRLFFSIRTARIQTGNFKTKSGIHAQKPDTIRICRQDPNFSINFRDILWTPNRWKNYAFQSEPARIFFENCIGFQPVWSFWLLW